MSYYVPGLGEKDPDKTIRSLMQAHEKTAANEADIATNAADIATNTADIAALQAAVGDYVEGPASATDNAAARYDGTTGKLVQNSALIIADTTGALSRSGGGGIFIQGRNNNTPPSAGDVGQTVSSVVSIGSGVNVPSGTAGVVWNSVALTAGGWLVFGNAGIVVTGGLLTHMHADHSTGTTLTTSPGGGSTTAAHVNANNANGVIWPLGTVPYFLSGNTTISSVITADITAGTAVAYGALHAVRFC